MAIKGNSKWKLKLIKLHRKNPMLESFILFIFGIIAYPINEHLYSMLFINKEYSNLDFWFGLLEFIFDLWVCLYFFKFSKEALNISIGSKKYTMRDFDDEFLRCVTEDLPNKNTDEQIKLYNEIHSLPIGVEAKSYSSRSNVGKRWELNSHQKNLEKGDN